jgi:alpha-galactosidase
LHQIQITYIGGGSKYWARQLMADLALCDRLGGKLVLHDLDHAAAERNVELGQAIFAHEQAVGKFQIEAEADLDAALRGSDFVVSSIEPGPIEARYADLEIPRRYGVLQSVGDTTGPGGILRTLRSVPTHLELAHAVMRYCPDAWVINYTNPMTLCTAAFYAAEPDIKAIGCCHEVYGTQRRVAERVQRWFDLDEPPPRQEIRFDLAGVNHFTVASGAWWRGHDLMPRLQKMVDEEAEHVFADHREDADARKAKGDYFGNAGIVCYDLLRRFDVLGAAGDRHLVEFLTGYLCDETTLHRWGVTLTPYEWRVKNAHRPAPDPATINDEPLERSDEEGVDMILALLGDTPLDSNTNLPQRGQMPGYPDGAVVETYAEFRQDRVTPLLASRLPTLIDGHLRKIVAGHQALLAACLDRDLDQVFAVVLSDPLVSLPVDRARAMFDEMIAHNQPWLDGWN